MQAISTLGVAVILHQVPKGFLLWEISRKASGVFAAILVIAGLLAATTAGFLLGGQVLSLIESRWVLYFQSFVAGGLLHVVVHHVSGGAEGQPRSGLAFASGAGALAACGILAWMPHGHLLEAPSDEAFRFRAALHRPAPGKRAPIPPGVRGSRAVAGVRSGLVAALVPWRKSNFFGCARRPVRRAASDLLLRRRAGLSHAHPARRSGRRRRGVPHRDPRDRPRLVFSLAGSPGPGNHPDPARHGLHRGVPFELHPLGPLLESASSLRRARGAVDRRRFEPGLARKLRRAFQFGYVELVDHLGVWIVVGLVVAAVIAALTEPGSAIGRAELARVASVRRGRHGPRALAGLPIYVCASGATPLAAVLLWKGVSPGAVSVPQFIGRRRTSPRSASSQSCTAGRAAALPAAVFAISACDRDRDQFLIPPGSAQPPAILGHPHTTLEIVSDRAPRVAPGDLDLAHGTAAVPRKARRRARRGALHSRKRRARACVRRGRARARHSHAAEEGCGCGELLIGARASARPLHRRDVLGSRRGHLRRRRTPLASRCHDSKPSFTPLLWEEQVAGRGLDESETALDVDRANDSPRLARRADPSPSGDSIDPRPASERHRGVRPGPRPRGPPGPAGARSAVATARGAM